MGDAAGRRTAVGRISKPYGLDGELMINLYSEFPGEFNREEPLFVDMDGLAVPLFIESFTRRGQKGAMVRFADIDTESRAVRMVGLELSMLSRAEGPGVGGLYMDGMAGYRAILGGGVEGTVAGFMDSGRNPLFEIDVNGRGILVPAADEFIESVDEERREVVFILPEGLIDLNG